MWANRINIKPESFDVEQRVEASKIAAEQGKGVRMEVWSGHTEFYTDLTVPIGKVAVYCARVYKGIPEFDKMLDSPEEDWLPWP